MKPYLAVLFGFLTMAPLHAQHFSVGVKAGVPLTDAFGTAHGDRASFVNNTQRYAIGPTAELHLPFRFSIETDALYDRLGFDSTFTDPNTSSFTSTRADSWTFPVLGKFELLPGPIRPIIDAGVTFRHISGVRQVRSVVAAGSFNTLVIEDPAEFNKRTDTGFTFGGGITFKAGPVRLTPEFRYTRWGGENFRDPVNSLLRTTRNDGVFLLGLTF